MRLTALVALAGLPFVLLAAPAPKAGPPRLLVVASYKDGNWDIYLVQPGTGEVKNLTENKAADTEPVWSSDGRQLAFTKILRRDVRSGRPVESDIYVMNADGSGQRNLTRTPGAGSHESVPVWSTAQKK